MISLVLQLLFSAALSPVELYRVLSLIYEMVSGGAKQAVSEAKTKTKTNSAQENTVEIDKAFLLSEVQKRLPNLDPAKLESVFNFLESSGIFTYDLEKDEVRVGVGRLRGLVDALGKRI